MRVPILDSLRHSERADASDEASALTPRGRALAAAVAAQAPRYALVASSPAARARETAELIGGRLDRVEPALAPDVSAVLDGGRYAGLLDLARYRALLRDEPVASALARQIAADWAELVTRLADEDAALAVSHGGIIELAATAIAEELGLTLRGRPFGLCEGVRVRYRGGRPAKIEIARAPAV